MLPRGFVVFIVHTFATIIAGANNSLMHGSIQMYNLLGAVKSNIALIFCVEILLMVQFVLHSCHLRLIMSYFWMQLSQLCKISGVKVSFDTENARDSFYRAAVNFVLDDCSKYVLLFHIICCGFCYYFPVLCAFFSTAIYLLIYFLYDLHSYTWSALLILCA
jgi:hypothetical protein